MKRFKEFVNKHIKKIDIFDFDDTLCLVPDEKEANEILDRYNTWAKLHEHKPIKKWKGNYWDSPESLSFPIIPETAPVSMINKEVINKFYESRRNPNCYTVVMTGRPITLENELNRILTQLNLKPDKLIMMPKEGNIVNYKINNIKKLLDEMPHVVEIEVFEDRGSQKAKLTGDPNENHVKAFRDMLKEIHEQRQKNNSAYGLKFKVNEIPVREDRIEVLKKKHPKYGMVD